MAGTEEGERGLPPNARASSAAAFDMPMALPDLELEMPKRNSGKMPAVQAPPSRAPRVQGQGQGHGPGSGAPQQQRSLSPQTSGDFEPDLGMGGASLELDIAPSPVSRGPISSNASSSGMGGMGMGGMGMGMGLGLDDVPASGSMKSSAGSISGRHEIPGPSQSFSNRQLLAAGTGPGLGLGPASADPVHHEAIALADYGEPPGKIWETPMYAYRVYKRQNDLRKELEQREDDFTQAKKEVEEAVVALGQRGRVAAEKMPNYKAPLDGIAAAEALLRSRDGQLMATMDAHTKQLADLDKRAQELETLLANTLSEQRVLEGELARAQEQVARLDAQDEALRRQQAQQARDAGAAGAAGASGNANGTGKR